MTTIQSLEDAVVALLAEFFTTLAYPTVSVGPLPESKAQNTELVDGQQIWAMIHTIKAQDERSTTSLYQETIYQFGIEVNAKKLRGDLMVYNLMDLTNRALLGKRPIAGSGWLKASQPVHWVLKGEEDGIFRAVGFFECPGLPLVADYDTATGDGAPLTETNFVGLT